MAAAKSHGKRVLIEHNLPTYDIDIILSYVTKMSKVELITKDEYLLSSQELAAYNKIIRDYCDGKPIAYILGFSDFYNISLKVNNNVLAPRSETEIIVDTVLKLKNIRKILDLGTGSGAIAIAIAANNSKVQVDAVDYSNKALMLAQENAARLKLTNVNFMLSNWLSNVISYNYDVIVSNPPYIAAHEPELENLKYEPTEALVAEENGLQDLRLIIDKSFKHLVPKGVLILEHGYKQKSSVIDLLIAKGYKNINTIQDYSGHDRVTLGTKP